MFEQMLNLVKNEVTKTVGGIDGIPAGKQSAVVETTASSLMSGLKKYATPANLSSLFGGGGGAGKMTSGLASGVVSALTSKVGLNPSVAQTIAGAVIPAVTALLGKHASSGTGGLNLESMASALMGGASGGSGSGAGGILSSIGGALGGLFGKKG